MILQMGTFMKTSSRPRKKLISAGNTQSGKQVSVCISISASLLYSNTEMSDIIISCSASSADVKVLSQILKWHYNVTKPTIAIRFNIEIL